MILADTNDLIEVVTSTTADIHCTADYADWDSAGASFTPGHKSTAIVSATTAILVASPTGTIKRQVISAVVANRHASASNDITIQHDDGSQNMQMWKGTLLAGESVIYDGAKFVRLNASGMIALEDAVVTFDGVTYKVANAGGGQALVATRHLIRADADETLISQTAAQAIFDSPTNGRITLAVGTYGFKLLLLVTGMSATSGNAQILFGGAGTFANWLWQTSAIDAAAVGTLLDSDVAFHQTNASAASVATAAVNTNLRVEAKGTVEVSVAGTFIPQIALVTAAAAIVESSSEFEIERKGDQGLISVGLWD